MLNPAAAALVAIGLAASLATAQRPAPPLSPEQAELLAEARHAALVYSTSLPDFICTQVVHRTEDRRGDGRWRVLDTLTIKLSYFEHKEDYKLMSIDGKATLLDYMYVGGALSTGEFGSRLLSVFHPNSAAEFHWKGPARLRKRKVTIFEYRVPVETSSFKLQFGSVDAGPNSIIAGYHGELWVDEESHMILRLNQHADIPAGFPISANNSEIDYDYAPVGGKPFLLPVRAQIVTQSGKYKAENDVEFKEYRKFNTEATISFGTEDEKPKPPSPKK
jgi:hypothetical protein